MYTMRDLQEMLRVSPTAVYAIVHKAYFQIGTELAHF